MKKIFLGLIAAGVILASCNSKTGANGADSAAGYTVDSNGVATAGPIDSANAAILSFETKSYDFGKIEQGKLVDYSFKFVNNGKSPLVIANAQASCGCTVPDWPKKPIMPGESAAIRVVFNSENKSGLQDKVVTVTANTIPAQSLVHLVGEVIVKK